MQDAEIVAELTEIFHHLFADDGIVLAPAMTADDVDGWDSMKHISLLVAIEDHFNIRIKTSEMDKLANVGDLIQVIRSKLP